MTHPIIRAALPELESELQQARDAKYQIMMEHLGESHRGGWEEPEEVLPYILNGIHDTLLVVLEAADLPETRKHLIEKWAEFATGGGIGKTRFDHQHDYVESKPFSYLETLIRGLRMSISSGIGCSVLIEDWIHDSTRPKPTCVGTWVDHLRFLEMARSETSADYWRRAPWVCFTVTIGNPRRSSTLRLCARDGHPSRGTKTAQFDPKWTVACQLAVSKSVEQPRRAQTRRYATTSAGNP